MLQWEADSTIDQTQLMQTMYGHPMLHAKYLGYLQGYKVSLRSQTFKYMTLKGVKTRYYNGELTKAELDERGWPQYQFRKPTKIEMESLLNADADLQKIQEQILYTESLVQSTELIMKDISNRYFLFKNMVEYEKFQAGA